LVAAPTPERRLRLAHALLERIEHRGAPGHRYGLLDVPRWGVALGVHRLPIVGGGAGAQPARSASGGLVLAFNGEVYRYRSLALRLPAVRSDPCAGDTAVLAELLDRPEPLRALESLDWEGAFVALDTVRGRLLAARDHLGIKPLYWSRTRAGDLLVSSELKAFLAVDGVERIEVVPPGAFLELALDAPDASWSETRYAEVGCAEDPDLAGLDEESLLGLLRDRLLAAVAARVPSFPYAVALSGGVDSAAVLALAARCGSPVTAYAAGNPRSPDLPHARRLCRELGVPLVEVPAPDEDALAARLTSTIWRVETWEWPVITHSLAMDELAAAAAADGHRVVLSGEGSDELFGGYWRDRVPAPAELHAERSRRLSELHRTNCRRLDRIGMAHTLEFRVPFLARPVTDLARRLPTGLLVRGGLTKWALRYAVRDLVGDEIAFRPKLTMATGMGYRYGSHLAGRGLLADRLAPSPGQIEEPWASLPRSEGERHLLQLFLSLGFGSARYLCSRSL
ncbi:MAG TPA: asparagine synthase-related protein, partial [Candidatus Dormibacteraeota bacterium]|nr:asparagine synthase-related protein [Candidatus Dormibacteraeota bacterium]